MSKIIKAIISALLFHTIDLFERYMSLYEQHAATGQVENDGNYALARFFADGSSGYVEIIIIGLIIFIWRKEIKQLFTFIIKKIKERD